MSFNMTLFLFSNFRFDSKDKSGEVLRLSSALKVRQEISKVDIHISTLPLPATPRPPQVQLFIINESLGSVDCQDNESKIE